MVAIRVRARALDMLGRQQIAGIPTAISELFKNAHDAYAERVEVDYYRKTGLFVLRDDGIGMSKKDFTERWLTLGTESKVGAGAGVAPPPADPNQPLRPIMGEKGIGRLAIAAIGPQTVILTRAKDKSNADELVVAFVHWGAFALPGVDLSDIDIPIRTFPGGQIPTAGHLQDMVDEVRRNVLNVATGLPQSATAAILSDLGRLNIDPQRLYASLPSGPSIDGGGNGTHFLIFPAEETLSEDIDGNRNDDIAPALIKVLVGFTNTMTPGHPPPRIVANFRDHGLDGVVTERIAGSAFFTPSEFRQADHHVSGTFDEYGNFRGSVGVYGAEPKEFILPSLEGGGNPLLCGTFAINFAYIQGEPRQTKLPPEAHAAMTAKLNKIGGLYIYRNGICILPYGNSDYDFLNIEQRRTKSASYYFFSYRRMFGIIDVSRENNPNLVEKAGREGFRENKAYRQLKRLLENFFIQLAGEFFRDGLQSDQFLKTRAELERNELLRRNREKQTRVRRASFAKQLDMFFEAVNARVPEMEVAELLTTTETRLGSLLGSVDTIDLPQSILDLESEVSRALSDLDERHRVTRPRGVGLTKQMLRDWEAYQTERARLESKLFAPAALKLSGLVADAAGQSGGQLDHRRRLDRALKDVSDRERKRAGSLERQARNELEQVQTRVLERTRQGLTALDTAIKETLVRFERTGSASVNAASFDTLREELEEKILSVAEKEAADLERLREQLRTIGTEEGLEQAEIAGALEEELEELREKEFAGLQLAQVGMALGIVHHEFASTINSVRNSLRRLKPWADANAKLGPLYGEIRSSFDHLDGYLTLFAPLDRRLHRKRTTIRGSEIHRFLSELFSERLKRHEVELHASHRFLEATAYGFPSSFYPVFVNLVDNAIFWVSRQQPGNRGVDLDYDAGSFTVADSGPGISVRDAESVFEMGFSRRPSGRGMGLYIARQVLKQIGYELSLDRPEPGRGARFRLTNKGADLNGADEESKA